MHDLAFTKEIINALNVKQNSAPNGSIITSINASLSPLSHVKPETLTETFRAMTKGTKFDKVALNVKVSQIKIICRACKHTFLIDKPTINCIKCNDSDLDIVYSKEFSIESIDVKEDRPHQNTA